MGTQQTLNIANGIDMDALQSTIRMIKEHPEMAKSKFRIRNKWLKGGHNQSTVSDFYCAGKNISHKQKFTIDADEPPILAGTDEGMNPVEHLLNALAACITTSMVYHAAVNGINIEELESELEGDLDLRGFTGLSDKVRKGYQNIRIKFKVKTDAENLQKLKELAKFSPVFDVVSNGTPVDIQIEKK